MLKIIDIIGFGIFVAVIVGVITYVLISLAIWIVLSGKVQLFIAISSGVVLGYFAAENYYLNPPNRAKKRTEKGGHKI